MTHWGCWVGSGVRTSRRVLWTERGQLVEVIMRSHTCNAATIPFSVLVEFPPTNDGRGFVMVNVTFDIQNVVEMKRWTTEQYNPSYRISAPVKSIAWTEERSAAEGLRKRHRLQVARYFQVSSSRRVVQDHINRASWHIHSGINGTRWPACRQLIVPGDGEVGKTSRGKIWTRI